MYYLWDLYNQTYVTYATAQALVFAWKRKFGTDFEQLNVTGNDMYPSFEPGGFANGLPLMRKVLYTRRYLVQDSLGRHIDIRKFPKDMWDKEEPKPRYYYLSWLNGGKDHKHRQNGPNMYRRLIQSKAALACEDLEDFPRPVRNGIKYRTKSGPGQYEAWDKYERRASHGYYAPRCWKDQAKTRRQWQRHDKTHQRITLKHIIRRTIAEQTEALLDAT